jgi:hypothetical protein
LNSTINQTILTGRERRIFTKLVFLDTAAIASADTAPAVSQNSAKVTLLALLVDDEGDGEYRFLVDDYVY